MKIAILLLIAICLHAQAQAQESPNPRDLDRAGQSEPQWESDGVVLKFTQDGLATPTHPPTITVEGKLYQCGVDGNPYTCELVDKGPLDNRVAALEARVAQLEKLVSILLDTNKLLQTALANGRLQ